MTGLKGETMTSTTLRVTTVKTAALLGGAGLALTACTTGGSQTGPAGSGGSGGASATIRTTIDQPASFDPIKGLSLPDFVASRASFDSLVRKDDNNTLVGGLAEKWESTGTSATFTLREGATCSDKTKITAEVVKASLEYLADPKNGSALTPQIFGPAGQPTFTAVDDKTLKIDLKSPWPDMVAGLSMSGSGIICPAGLKDTAALAKGSVKGAESGPYVLTSSEHGVRYTYTLRDDYTMWPAYAQALPGEQAKTIEYNVIVDKNATANQLIAGQLDVGFVNAQSVKRLEGAGKISVDNKPFSDFYVLFNEREGSPFTDAAKRKAVAQVLDRKAFENVTSSGMGQVTTQLVANDTPCADPDGSPVIPLDPAAAKSALTGVKIRMVGAQILGPKGAGNTYVQEQLRAAGADVQLQNLDVGGWISTVFGKPSEWDMTVYADLNFIGTMSNPIHSLIGPSLQEGGGNVGATKDPVAAAAMTEYWKATDDPARCEAVNTAMDSAISNAHVIPLANDPRLMASREGFTVVSKGGSLDDQHLLVTK